MSTTLTVPRGLKGLAPLMFDLTQVFIAEARISEVAALTPTKAPELLATFNTAYLECARNIAMLEAELTMAKRAADKVRSVVVLERAPAKLLQLGLVTSRNPAGSEDLRKAVLDGDVEYQDALSLTDQIECNLELFRGKQKGLEMAYTSVKKLVGEQTFNFGRVVNGGNEGNAGVGSVVGMGRPNYGR